MYFDWSALNSQERRSEMLRQAEHERLVKIATGWKPVRIHVRTLGWVGRRLSRLGDQLQEYGRDSETCSPWQDVRGEV